MGCTGCHTLQRIFRTHYNTEEFAPIARRMGRYYEGSIPEAPQVLPAGSPGRPGEYGALSREEADFLTKVNLSSTPQWQYPLKTLPRLKGKSDRVIITEYDLPRKLV